MDTTSAIVFNKIKYGDSSIIVRCFTRDFGMKSYLVKGAYKPKSKLHIAYFEPLHILKIASKHKPNQNLHYFESLELENPYKNIHQNILKQTMVFFIADFLYESLKHYQNINVPLYDYIVTALQWFDLHHQSNNFHLVFFLKLTQYLGFYPNISQGNYFNLETGCSQKESLGDYVLGGEILSDFLQIYHNNLQTIAQIHISTWQRRRLLEHLITYFSLHLPQFSPPKSLSVLQTFFK